MKSSSFWESIKGKHTQVIADEVFFLKKLKIPDSNGGNGASTNPSLVFSIFR
jgi:hypothetical protein